MALSRDHHICLSFGRKIKEGIQRRISLCRINRYISFFWKHHLQGHFEEEEELLFCLFDNELTQKARKDHEQLSSWFLLADNNALRSREEYQIFADFFILHIRFEEEELFPYLEAELSSETLAGVGESLAKSHKQPYTDNYQDRFWADDRKYRIL